MSTTMNSDASDARADYIRMINLGKAIIYKSNYEKALENLDMAKAYLEKADDVVAAKKNVVWFERAVLYSRCIMEGIFPDPNPPSSTSMYIAGQTAKFKII